MIASRNQLVTLTNAALDATRLDYIGRAKVISLVYLDQPEGERGVQLDRELGGSRWWMEQSLQPAEPIEVKPLLYSAAKQA